LSFFDEDDEPPRRAPRPRRARPAGGPAAPDQQTLIVRRGVALLIGVLVLVLLVVAVNSCRSSAQRNALKDYNGEHTSLIRESDRQVGDPFFELLSSRQADSPQDLQTQIAGLRAQAETQLGQAQDLDVPDDMVPAHRSLLTVLELRRDALDFIAQRVRTALGDQGDAADEAITQITAQMQSFLASDVVHQARVVPLIKEALDEAEIGGQVIQRTQFIDSLAWLSEETVAARLNVDLDGSGSGRRRAGQPAPGLHGTGLSQVSIGETRLQPGTANRVTVSGDPVVSVQFQNQGENDEFEVEVVVRLTPADGGKAITARRTVDQVPRGETATANIALRNPPIGESQVLRVDVRRVPGETKADNNRAEYPVLFQRG